MNDKKLKNILSLSPKDRYDYFIREVVQFGEVWTIATDEGYVIFKDKDNDEIFPVWPHKEVALESIFEEHKNMGAKPEKMKLESFVGQCVPDMITGGVLFGVFYNKDRKAIVVNGDQLIEDIENEYDEIWGEE